MVSSAGTSRRPLLDLQAVGASVIDGIRLLATHQATVTKQEKTLAARQDAADKQENLLAAQRAELLERAELLAARETAVAQREVDRLPLQSSTLPVPGRENSSCGSVSTARCWRRFCGVSRDG